MSDSSTSRRTPLHDCHLAAGARMVDFAGWRLPVQYAGTLAEHRAVRQAAGLFDVSHMGELRVSGPAAEAALQALTPNDVSRLRPGRAHYSALLTERGTYIDDLLVYRLAAEEFLLVVNAANRERDYRWLAERAGDGVEVADESERWALLALQGPAAEAILGRLTPLDLAAIKYYRFAEGAVNDRPALVSRTGYTGEDGFELYVAGEDAAPLWDRLLAAGAGDGLQPAGLAARDSLRLEAAMALYGHELDESTTPLEAGLEWTVKWQKGPFVGREALAAEKERGSRRRLIGIEITGRGIARQGAAVLVGGRPAGAVTSGSWSPTLERAIAMAMLEDPPAPGGEVEVEVRGRLLAGRCVELPFYRRD